MSEISSQYDPKSVESGIYKKWLDAGVFHAVPDGRPVEKRFSVVIPPPNVTGALHLGHAINGTIQDILVRYHRMKGDNTLWMPGIDHAGIATQAVVEKTIFEKEKKNRHDLGREELVKRIWEWKEKFGDRILMQLASMGCSCDWERTRFTLDEGCARAVREAFFRMFKDGLIFRGKRLVNWDTHLQTAVADDEIYYEAVKGQMVSIRYPVERMGNEERGTRNEESGRGTEGGETLYLVVATTRPETMLGDTAVAVHPEDVRYKHLIGRHVIVPLVGRRIPIIADGLLVDPAFGTGVVKVTPAHDPNDYATGLRHGLEQINLLTADGKVNENGAGEFMGKKYSYVGMKFGTAARKQVLADLEGLGLIAEAKVHEHEVGHSDRSKTAIEPFLSDQWFVRMGDIGEELKSEPRPLEDATKKSDPSEPRPSGSDRVVKVEQSTAHSTAMAYFITFHTHASWLHGQEPGAVDPDHNAHNTAFVPPDPKHLEMKIANLQQPPVTLTLEQRESVLKTILEVASHRGWNVHAANIRSTHVHLVVGGNHAPERMLNDFKSYATRRMTEASLLESDAKVWSRHGSTRYLWKSDDVASAVHYTLDSQGDNAPGTFFKAEDVGTAEAARSLPDGRGSDGSAYGRDGKDNARGGIRLADGTRKSGLAQAAMDAVIDGRVKITPERYAKGYLDWLGQKRDWCISRQLWWGHRIPVWSKHYEKKEEFWGKPGTQQDSDQDQLMSLEQAASIAIWFVNDSDNLKIFRDVWPDQGGFTVLVCTPSDVVKTLLADVSEDFDLALAINSARPLLKNVPLTDAMKQIMELTGHSTFDAVLDDVKAYLDEHKELFRQIINESGKKSIDIIELLRRADFIQDPDVLDTWFSSALWPISTMGWPGALSEPRPSGSDRKTSKPELLSYFYPTSVLSTAREILTLWVARMVMFGLYCQGDVPFRDVYIHAVIQDGEGRPMKKSLGNGVDPVDIVASHGADALRFTLASVATETQDIRMPVVKDAKTGVNTSPKFDFGRNFANKIWNAARFILGTLEGGAVANEERGTRNEGNAENAKCEMRNAEMVIAGAEDISASIRGSAFLEDRWILSRLNATVRATEQAINGYKFADYASAVYQFFWSDLCDWYLEIAKTRIKTGDAGVRAMLLHCLETSLKLLHPMMPFVTEAIWEKLPGKEGMLVVAVWPEYSDGQVDPIAEQTVARAQEVASAIREMHNRYSSAKGKDVIIRPANVDILDNINEGLEIISSSSSSEICEVSLDAVKPANAATAVLAEATIFIAGAIDKDAECAKLMKRRDELLKFIAGGKAKLANEAAVAKVPANVVQGWRDQLAKQEAELAAVQLNLQDLAL